MVTLYLKLDFLPISSCVVYFSLLLEQDLTLLIVPTWHILSTFHYTHLLVDNCTHASNDFNIAVTLNNLESFQNQHNHAMSWRSIRVLLMTSRPVL